MNFDEAQRHGGERVSQSNTGVTKRAGIDDDEIGAVGARQMDAIDQNALMIGLKKHYLGIFLLRHRDKLAFDVGQRLAAVNGRLACS
jgi:hypothetical protein